MMTSPMTKAQVLAVLDNAIHDGTIDVWGGLIELRAARSAVAALYERCEALERAVERKNEALLIARDRMASLSTRAHDYFIQQYATDCAYNKAALVYTGTEPSDAEGGG